jgi:hypothetical protein
MAKKNKIFFSYCPSLIGEETPINVEEENKNENINEDENKNMKEEITEEIPL